MARPFLSGARARAKFTVMTHRTIEINKASKKNIAAQKDICFITAAARV